MTALIPDYNDDGDSPEITDCICCNRSGRCHDDSKLAEKLLPRLPQHEWDITAWSYNLSDLPNETGSKKLSHFPTLKRIFLYLPFDLQTLLNVAATCRSWRILSDRLPHWRYLLPLKNETFEVVSKLKWNRPFPFVKKEFITKTENSGTEEDDNSSNKNQKNEVIHIKLVPISRKNIEKDCEIPCSLDETKSRSQRQRVRSVFSHCDGCWPCLNWHKVELGVDSEDDEREFYQDEKGKIDEQNAQLQSKENVLKVTKDEKCEREDFRMFFTGEVLEQMKKELSVKSQNNSENVEAEESQRQPLQRHRINDDDDDDDEQSEEKDNSDSMQQNRANTNELSSIHRQHTEQYIVEDDDNSFWEIERKKLLDEDGEYHSFFSSPPAPTMYSAWAKNFLPSNSDTADPRLLQQQQALIYNTNNLLQSSGRPRNNNNSSSSSTLVKSKDEQHELYLKMFPIRVRRFTVLRHLDVFTDPKNPSLRFIWTYPSLSSYLNHVRYILTEKQKATSFSSSLFWQWYRGVIYVQIITALIFFVFLGLTLIPLTKGSGEHAPLYAEEAFITISYSVLTMFLSLMVLFPLAMYIYPRDTTSPIESLMSKDRPEWMSSMKSKLRWKMTAHFIMTACLLVLLVPAALLSGRIYTAHNDFLMSENSVVTVDQLFSSDEFWTNSTNTTFPVNLSQSQVCDIELKLPSEFLPNSQLLSEEAKFLSFPSGTTFFYHPPYFLENNLATFSLDLFTCQVEKNRLLNLSTNFGSIQTNESGFITRNSFGYYTVVLPPSENTSSRKHLVSNLTFLIIGNQRGCPFWSSASSYGDGSKISNTEELLEHHNNAHSSLIHERFKSILNESSSSPDEIIQNISTYFPELGETYSIFDKLFTNATFANETVFNRNWTSYSSIENAFAPSSNSLFPCQFVNNSAVTVKSNRSLLLRLANKWTSHWTSFYKSDRDPYHEKNWEKVATDYLSNGIIPLTADDAIFLAHEPTSIPVVPEQIPNPLDDESFLRVKNSNEEIADYWTAAHLPGIRKMKQYYETGLIILCSIAAALFVWSSLSSIFAVGVSRFYYLVFVGVAFAIFVYPLALLILVGSVCADNANESDSYELSLPVVCLFVNKADTEFPSLYATIVLIAIGCGFFILSLMLLKSSIQRCVRRMRARCQDFADFIKGKCRLLKYYCKTRFCCSCCKDDDDTSECNDVVSS